ncbi:KiSS-1 receptor [Strongyloides ratti]|uniref:KiSS-1 receptor n=1 Tax=Strongyloides ratti TaxID=34506 RepID=A0A090N0C9_STRRB|nr:KiSS-1 receptor [Strongyloides ratti]CEF70467.1 KiSS-1 receptor [Strongyloides ratti]
MNLAIADLIFILVYIPGSTANLFDKNILPESFCLYQIFLTYMSIFASAYTLVLLAFDRLVAVVYPLRAVYVRTFKNTIISCCIVWILSFLIYFFTFFISTSDENNNINFKNKSNTLCFDINKMSNLLKTKFSIKKLYFTFNIVSYVIPLLAIIIMYTIILNFLHKIKSKELKTAVNKQWRRRITKTIWLVIATFAICWFPQNSRIFYIAITYTNDTSDNENLLKTHNMILIAIFQIMAYSNYCINPILYCLMLKRYRWYVNNFWIFIRSFFIPKQTIITIEREKRFTKYKSSFDDSYHNSIRSTKSNNPTNV